MSSNHPRARTHTLPDDRALFLFGGRVPRRKSASSLPHAAAAAQNRRRTPSSSHPSGASPGGISKAPGSVSSGASVAASSSSSLPPQPPPPVPQPPPQLPPLATSNPITAPTTPSIQTPVVTPLGPWSGTFLDADPDGDADSDDDFYDAPEATSDSDAEAISASLPELRQQRHTPRTQSLSQPSQSRASPQPPPSSAKDAKDAQKLPPQKEPPTSLPPPPPPSSNVRDSFISILDDPFFQRYHNSGTDWFGDEDDDLLDPATPSLPPDPPVFSYTTSRSGAGSADHQDPISPGTQDKSRHDKSSWPLPRRESLTVNDQGLRPPPPKKMATVNIAVIGADGVGKSAFIQRAMRLPKPPTAGITAMRIDVDSKPFVVALIELDLEHFDVDPKQKIHWPKRISGHIVPHIDGALMLYDVMNKDSIRELPPTLSALHNSSLPTILVATKCDNPESSRQINADGLATVFPSILTDFKTSANSPGNTRDCLQAIVLAAVYNRQGAEKSDNYHHHNHNSYSSSSVATTNTTAASTTTANTKATAATTASNNTTATTTTTRRRAASSAAHLDAPPDSVNSRPHSSEQGSGKHSRASSDLSLLRGGPTSSSSADRDGYYRTQNARSPRVEYHPNTPHQLHHAATSFGAEMTDEKSSQTVQGMLRSTGVRLDAGQDSFLDIEESDAESLRRFSEDVPILQRNDESMFDKPAKAAGTPFNELVDRLLAAPMTRADTNFSDVFLCLYRKFAAPHELLSHIIASLTRTWDDKSFHFLERTATQFRYIEVLNRWVSLYPGDFARPASRRQLEALIRRLADEPIFTLSAQQIKEHLDNDVAEDDDTWWAKCDDPPPKDDPTSIGIVSSTPGKEQHPSDSMRSLTLQDSQHSSDRPSSEAGSGNALATGFSSGRGTLSHFPYHTYEDYEREAATMVPMATLPLNKFRYHIFMDMDANEVADEITRIDWIMFSSIRIRDLVRHVSLSGQDKERCRSLKNADRMIAHFNHIAKWVSNMILIRDKAKHRAPCMQKFMVIALRLRQLRNYNGLAAMLAGINSTAIHRLAQTRALIDPDIQKSFARLVLLMSTQKSHFAYRLAWENSPLPRIPFMPLHRRDLVSAEEGSRTFVGPQGDRINWKKFEVLGEVLLPIMKSQGTPYPNLKKHQASREMILDCRMPMDEEDVYQRSVQVEPVGGGADLKKKFPWLPK